MIQIGEFNSLSIVRERDPGLFLSDDEDNEVLLPNRYKPKTFKIYDKLDVFVYLDNEERLVAVTEKPYITRGGFALLRCNEVSNIGAFLDWGLLKELFCPFKEQVYKMKPGGWYFVHCYLDEETNRLVASSKTNRFLDNKILTIKQFDSVDLIVSHPSDIGMNVIVNNKHLGLIYSNHLSNDLSIGDKLKGIINKIRPGNKLDISLGQIGYRNIEPNSKIILEKLENNNNYLPLSDKSDPDKIKFELRMSKKSFKKALGSLYKQRLIEFKDDGIYLIKSD